MEAIVGAAARNFAPYQPANNIGNEIEDIFHICPFCERNFSDIKQYNFHLKKHLKQSSESFKPHLQKESCENECSSLLQYPYSNSSITERELNLRNPVKSRIVYGKNVSPDLNIARNVEDVLNTRTQVPTEINESNRLEIGAPSSTANTLNFLTQSCSETHRNNENKLNDQPLWSSIINSCSDIFGDAVEFEFKIHVRPGKNINSHQSANRENCNGKPETVPIISNGSTSFVANSNQKDNVCFPQNDLKLHHHNHLNEKTAAKSHSISYQQPSRNQYLCNPPNKCSESNNQENTFSNFEQNNFRSTVFANESDELSNDSSDIIIIEDPYICEICKLSFCQQEKLESHSCTPRRQIQANSVDIHSYESKKISVDPVIVSSVSVPCKQNGVVLPDVKDEKITEDNNVYRVEVQYYCNTCNRDFTQTIELDSPLCALDQDTITEKKLKGIDFRELLYCKNCTSQSKLPFDMSFENRNNPVEKITNDVDLHIIKNQYSSDVCKRDFSHKNEYNYHHSHQNSQIFVQNNSNSKVQNPEGKSTYHCSRKEIVSGESNDSTQSKLPNTNCGTQKMVDDNLEQCNIEILFECNVCKEQFSGKRELHICTLKAKNVPLNGVDGIHELDFNTKDGAQLPGPKNVDKEEMFTNLDMSIVTYPIYCDRCDNGFFEEKDLDIHMISCTSKRYSKRKKSENNCFNKRNDSKSNKRKDVLSPTQNKPQRSKKTKGTLSSNVSNSSTVSNYVCYICSKILVDQDDRNAHLYTHSKTKKFFCIFCNKVFISCEKLVEHITLHKSEKLYFCEKCNKGFVREEDLKEHFLTHKSYVCDICNISYSRKDSVQKHSLQHIKQSANLANKSHDHYSKLSVKTHSLLGKPFCKRCNRSFSTMYNLKTHLKSHKFPFNCNICSAGFDSKITLEKHLNRHSNIRSHVCLICYSGFFTKNALHKHLAIHTARRPIKCEVCKKTFLRNDHKERHKRNVHQKKNLREGIKKLLRKMDKKN